MHIQYVEIFNDNYIWLILSADKSKAVAVDPGDSGPLLNYLKKHNMVLTDILITHHHADHTGGVLELTRHFDLNVYGPISEEIPGLTSKVQEGDIVTLGDIGIEFTVIEVPGHTLGHIAYYSHPYAVLFCGDTLFSAGCGRIFEGTSQQMYDSLQKIMSLPIKTKIYCTHEYTLQNLKFAQFIEPENHTIALKIAKVSNLRAKLLPSLPTTLAIEQKINPFLRCAEPKLLMALQNNKGLEFENPLATFTYLRNLKDNF